MTILSPSILGADLLHLGEEIEKTRRLGIRWLHLDQMDGLFTPTIAFGPQFVRAIRLKTDQFLDVHLMLEYPMQHIEDFVAAGADLITIHYECKDDPEKALRAIAAHGVKTGLSIKPATPPEAIEHLLPLCDLVLVMTVQPGYGGQTLREDCVKKLPIVKEMIQKTGRDIYLEVDGGIKAGNMERVVKAGANVLVMGTGLFGVRNPERIVSAAHGEDAPCTL
ncbi:MAG: ribulose-phosphate 3-epimerase [Clostridia bacterium]|nr:ribulose-phosphate 3-epimerase [Clostridia bacterium]